MKKTTRDRITIRLSELCPSNGKDNLRANDSSAGVKINPYSLSGTGFNGKSISWNGN